MDTLYAMPHIYGRYEASIDDKHRIGFPAALYGLINQRARFNLAFNPDIDFVAGEGYAGFKVNNELIIAISSSGQTDPLDRVAIAREADISDITGQYYLLLDKDTDARVYNALDYFLLKPEASDKIYISLGKSKNMRLKRFSPELYNQLSSFYDRVLGKITFQGMKDHLNLL